MSEGFQALEEGGFDVFEFHTIEGELLKACELVDPVKIIEVGAANVQFLEGVLHVVEVFQPLDGIVIEGKFLELHVLKTLDLSNFVLVKCEDGHLRQSLQTLQGRDPILRTADLHEIGEVRQWLQTVHAILIEADVFQHSQILDASERSDGVTGDIQDTDLGEICEEGDLLDASEVEVQLGDSLAEVVVELLGELLGSSPDDVHLVTHLSEIHAHCEGFLHGVVTQLADVQDLHQLRIEGLLLSLNLHQDNYLIQFQVSQKGLVAEYCPQLFGFLLELLGSLDHLDLFDVGRLPEQVYILEFFLAEGFEDLTQGARLLLQQLLTHVDTEHDILGYLLTVTALSDDEVSASHLRLQGAFIDGKVTHLSVLNNRNDDLNANTAVLHEFLYALAEDAEEEDLLLEVELADEEAASREGLVVVCVLLEVVEEGTEVPFEEVLLTGGLLHVGVVALPAVGLPASLAGDVEEAGPGDLVEGLAGDTNDGSRESLGIARIGLRVLNLHAGMLGLLSMLHLPLLLADDGFVVPCSLLESRPDGCIFGNGAQFGPFELIEEVVELVQLLLLLIDVADDCQLDLTDQTLAQLCIDEDVPCSIPKTVLDTDDLEGISWVIALLVETADEVYHFALLGDALAAQQVEDLEVHQIQVKQVLLALLLVEVVGDADLGLVDGIGQIQQEVDGLVELAADVGGDGTFEVVAVLAHTRLLPTDMPLRIVRYEVFQGQQDLHVVALLLDVSHLLFKILLPFSDFLIQSILDLCVKVEGKSTVILKLILRILDQLFRISDDLIKFLHPFGDHSQHRWGFDKENAVFDLFISVFGSVLVDLLTDRVFGVVTHLLSVDLVLMGLFLQDWCATFMERTEDFLEDLAEKVLEDRIFLVAAFDHVVDGLHDLLCVIATLLLPKNDLLRLTHLTDQVELHLALIVNVGDLPPQGNVCVLHLSLRILHAKVFQYADGSSIDVLDESPAIGLDACDLFLPLDGSHELDDVVDDVFSEEDLGLVEGKFVLAEEVPADGGSGSIDASQPVLCHCRCLHFVLNHLQLVVLHHFLNRDLDLHLALVAEGHDMGNDGVVLLLLCLLAKSRLLLTYHSNLLQTSLYLVSVEGGQSTALSLPLGLILLVGFDQIFQVLPVNAVEAVLHWILILILFGLDFLLALHCLFLLLGLHQLIGSLLNILLVIHAFFVILLSLQFPCSFTLYRSHHVALFGWPSGSQ